MWDVMIGPHFKVSTGAGTLMGNKKQAGEKGAGATAGRSWECLQTEALSAAWGSPKWA